MTTGFSLAATEIAAQEPGVVFGLMGDGNMRLTTALIRDHQVRYVGTVHEAGAVAAADGYHRATGGIGYATITHGPGLTNAVTALTEAVRNRSQLLVITSEPPQRREYAQHIDSAMVVAPTGAGYILIRHESDIVAGLRRAARAARKQRRPIVVNVPLDVLNADLDADGPAYSAPTVTAPLPTSTSLADIASAVAALRHARRPAVLIGRGAMSLPLETVHALGDRLKAPILTTLLARDRYQESSRSLGVAGGLGTRAACGALDEADALLVLGAGLNHFTTQHGRFTDGKTIIQVDTDFEAFGLHVEPTVAVTADAGMAAADIISALDAASEDDWAQPWFDARDRETLSDEYESGDRGSGLDARDALIHLNATLPRERIIVTDVGRFVMAAWKYLSAPSPGQLIHTCTFASIGLGLATAVGVAATGRPTVAVVGDGGLMMSLGELSTIARHSLPVVILVVNDGAYGAEHMRLRQYGEDPQPSLMAWPHLAEVARACAIPSIVVDGKESLQHAATRFSELPTLVDIRTDPAIDYGDW
ncbi:thiamine pyrophosphate-binding protein [Microbacterium paraoxydans]|uniref:thiamine pyrophosphate-binding protein n=1 Tax=Microbacterium paraoxydans TaxID=199592 RepID=UPI001CFA6021|nr:thiamine pyrophosphate-binding protein [Microbacterium paraoxydans]